MRKIDSILLVTVILLNLFGLLMIFNASSYIAFRDFQDKYYYIREQAMWSTIGILGMFFFSFFDYKKFQVLALPILIGAFALLIAVFLPGIGTGPILGAKRWINLGFTTLQPAEFVKLSLAIYLAAWLSNKEKDRLVAFFLLVGAVFFLVMLQPDMGTGTIILFEAIAIYYLSGAPVRPLIMLAPVMAIIGFILIKLAPYRAARLTAFLNMNGSLDGMSYHVKQILIALGGGGMFGVGLGNSLQKFAYLPENVTDSIFPIIAEELGFFGSTILILMFAVLVWRGFYIASHARDTFGKLLAGGIMAFLGIQIIINLGAMTASLPLTGVPLAFISYGGSALIVDFCAIGIILNIAKQSNMVKHSKQTNLHKR